MKTLTVFIISTILVQVFAHSYVSKPATRGNQGQTQTGCVMPSCAGPCDRPASQAGAGTAVSRGSQITINWPRNNHPGGFVRFAWAPTAQSDTASIFDANIDQYRCFEIPFTTCKPGNPAAPNEGDGPGATQTDCGVTLTVPGWLTDGKWTLQWAWFGGGYTLGDYYSCIDYAVSGGTQTTKQNPIFYGGDYANQADNTKCKYFNTNKLHFCLSDGCPSSPAPAQQQTGYPVDAVIGQTAGSLSTDVSGSISGSADSTGNTNVNYTIPCNSDYMCKSGICQSNGYCYVAPGKKLDKGGIAAIVFAMFFIVCITLIVVFAVVNKSEWSNWRPFNRSHGGGYGFKGSVNPTNS